MEGKTKEKLLFILERLRKTDEQHPVNTNELIAYLAEKGVTAERKSVARDVAALRDAGYIIGCNTYRNKAYGAVDTDEVKKDLESWETTITPILGQTNIFAFAKQSDIAAAGEAYSDKKFEALTLGGYSYFLGFCDDGQPWMRIEGSYIRQGRLMVTGNTLEKKGSWFTGMFDAASVMERGR